ncbi:uncharacterized protein LOC131997957 [Stomoxys calcitrans]|uniref:uncharacterized protein LOC131997957 n=1 Tax=Stomoxys calcitrans TaxID=35570 RepID=UPI0027E310C3|nr:uncharacterized protein LOC131997957 [Stomoxys calcitrans]
MSSRPGICILHREFRQNVLQMVFHITITAVMLSRKIIFLVLAIHCIDTTETAKRRFNLMLNNVTCIKVNSLMKSFGCSLKNFGTSRYAVDAQFLLERPFEKNAEVHVMVYFTPSLAKKAVKFLDIKLNICDMLSTVISNPLLKVILDETRKSSNLPYRCPVKANFVYTFSNFSLTAETLPLYTPFMKFNFTLNTYDNEELVSKFLLEGTTVPK